MNTTASPSLSEQTTREERRLLGSLLRWPAALDDVALVVSAEDFASDAHQKVFRCLAGLHGRKPVDLATVAADLRDRGWLPDLGGNGYAYLAELWDGEPTGANAEWFAGLVREASLRRQFGRLGAEMQREAADPSSSSREALERFETRLLGLSELGHSGRVYDLRSEVDAAADRIDARKRGEPAGLLTGWADLDELLGGLRDGELTLVAARPSVGKSAFGLGLSLYLTRRERVPVLLVSLEMSRAEVVESRLLPMTAGVDSSHVRSGTLSHADLAALTDAGRALRECPLWIDDQSNQTAGQLSANARRLKRSRGVRAVVVDYLQLVAPEDKKAQRYEQVGAVSRRLKLLSRELSVPVVAMAQLNRAAEDRREPRLSDLRESGGLEQDADNVVLLHRPEEPDGPVTPIECIVAKQRNGPIGRLTLGYRRRFARFEDYARG